MAIETAQQQQQQQEEEKQGEALPSTALELALLLHDWMVNFFLNDTSSWHSLHLVERIGVELLTLPPTPKPWVTDSRGYTAYQNFDLLTQCFAFTCDRLDTQHDTRAAKFRAIAHDFIAPTCARGMRHERLSAQAAWSAAYTHYYSSSSFSTDAIELLIRAPSCVLPFTIDPEHLPTNRMRQAHGDAKCLYILHSFIDTMELAITCGPLPPKTQPAFAERITWAHHANANLNCVFRQRTPLRRIRDLLHIYQDRSQLHHDHEEDPFARELMHAELLLRNIIKGKTNRLLNHAQALICQYFHTRGCATCHGHHATTYDAELNRDVQVYPMAHGKHLSLIAHLAEASSSSSSTGSVLIRFFVAQHMTKAAAAADDSTDGRRMGASPPLLFNDTITIFNLSHLSNYLKHSSFVDKAWNLVTVSDPI